MRCSLINSSWRGPVLSPYPRQRDLRAMVFFTGFFWRENPGCQESCTAKPQTMPTLSQLLQFGRALSHFHLRATHVRQSLLAGRVGRAVLVVEGCWSILKWNRVS